MIPSLVPALFSGASAFWVVQRMIDVVDLTPPDYWPHSIFAAEMVRTGVIPGHFLFFVVAAAASGWTSDPNAVLDAMPALLGLVVGVLVLVTAGALRTLVPAIESGVNDRSRALQGRLLRWLGPWTGAILVFSFSAPVGEHGYLGQFPPMVWHNSTVIFLLPFAVGLFWATWSALVAPTMARLAAVAALLAVNIAIKPSYVFCWLVVMPLWILVYHRNSRFVLAFGALAVVAVALLGIQASYLLHSDAYSELASAAGSSQQHISFAPFETWRVFSSDPLLSLLASNLLTITAVVAWGAEILRYRPFQFAGGFYVVGLAVFVLFDIKNGVVEAGDFSWQMIPCTFILFLTIAAYVWTRFLEQGATRLADRVVLAVAALQVLLFVQYMHAALATRNYF